MEPNERDILKTIAIGLKRLEEYGLARINPPDPEAGSPGTIANWRHDLRGLSVEAIAAGFDWITANWTDEFKRRPMPGDIRKAVAASSNKGHAEAWEEIQRDGHHHLYPRMRSSILRPHDGPQFDRPQWSSPEVAALVEQMGGVEKCLMVTEAQMPTIRAQVRDIWAAIQQRSAGQAAALPQPPRAPQLASNLPALSEGVVSPETLRARQAAREAQHRPPTYQPAVTAQGQAHGAAMARQALEQTQARMKAERQAKLEASEAKRMAFEEQKRQVRQQARDAGIDIGADEEYTGVSA